MQMPLGPFTVMVLGQMHTSEILLSLITCSDLVIQWDARQQLAHLVRLSCFAARCYLDAPQRRCPCSKACTPHKLHVLASSRMSAHHTRAMAFEGMHCQHTDIRLAAAGQQIHVRPRLDTSGQAHAWSQVSTQGDTGVSLAALEEGQSSLLSCSASATSVQQGAALGTHMQPGAALPCLHPSVPHNAVHTGLPVQRPATDW